MKKETYTCDIKRNDHEGLIYSHKVPVIFDHDQEDGKLKVAPYFEMIKLDLCEHCFEQMTGTRTLIYGFGAMGYNEYTLLNRSF